MTTTYYPKVDTLASFGAYSPVSTGRPGEIVAIAGQFGTDATGSFPDTDSAADQVHGAYRNVGNALAAVDLDFSNVLKFNTYLVGRDTIPAFMEARRNVFADIYPEGTYPPNTLLLVSGLVEERFVVEIEALAVRPETQG